VCSLDSMCISDYLLDDLALIHRINTTNLLEFVELI
jgi:hypothetical protein